MKTDRRQFLGLASNAQSSAGKSLPAADRGADADTGKGQYKYRIAFELWLNDVRNEAMPLENWPYGALDYETVDRIVRALDVQSESGYDIVDLAGQWTTYGWPVNIEEVKNVNGESTRSLPLLTNGR